MTKATPPSVATIFHYHCHKLSNATRSAIALQCIQTEMFRKSQPVSLQLFLLLVKSLRIFRMAKSNRRCATRQLIWMHSLTCPIACTMYIHASAVSRPCSTCEKDERHELFQHFSNNWNKIVILSVEQLRAILYRMKVGALVGDRHHKMLNLPSPVAWKSYENHHILELSYADTMMTVKPCNRSEQESEKWHQ